MKKISKWKEEKNKIIKQIEKNLRVIYPNRHRKQIKQLKAIAQLQHFKVPFVHFRQSLTKSQNIYPHCSIHQQHSYMLLGKINKPVAQTMTFITGQKNSNNPTLLTNQRTSYRSFMKLHIRKPKFSLQREFRYYFQIDPSPSKVNYTIKQGKIKQISVQNNSMTNEEGDVKTCTKNKNKKKGYEKKILKDICCSQQTVKKEKKQRSNSNSLEMTNFRNTKNNCKPVLVSDHKISENERSRTYHCHRRSYSPWNYKNEEEQPLQIWDNAL